MNSQTKILIPYGNAICYSGYRQQQSPITHSYPSYEQVLEDLLLLSRYWTYLRIYDCSVHADLVLRAIRNEDLKFKVMLGADVAAENNNPDCPWHAEYSDLQLRQNYINNDRQIDRLIELANEYTDIVFSVSVGNEATVDWSDHLVPLNRLIGFVDRIKETVSQPVTFCENYVPWTSKLETLADKLDFISIHTYPVWEYHTIDTALEYTKTNYFIVANHYPDKLVVITEAGWTTKSNGRGIDAWNASVQYQASYYDQLMQWSRDNQILTFLFEAFDEPWKGSDDPDEPEKHWGLFTVDRKPKPVIEDLYQELLAS